MRASVRAVSSRRVALPLCFLSPDFIGRAR
jgi:hypothetical protein